MGRGWKFGRMVRGAGLAFLLAAVAQPALGRTILFVGNSFTFGYGSPVRFFHPERVRDLNNGGIGGVPALFRTFADQAGLDYDVALETSPGKTLAWHMAERPAQLAGAWDEVVLQGYSTLNRETPGDPAEHIKGAHDLARMFRAANPTAKVRLVSTWSRADLTYKPQGHWYGKPIEAMADDLAAASALAVKSSADLTMVTPVGAAWSRAMRAGVADPNPYDGIAFGQVSLWTWDQYHASTEGYYLEALVIFGQDTGVDPRSLGGGESAALELGMSATVTKALQAVAYDALAGVRGSATKVPGGGALSTGP